MPITITIDGNDVSSHLVRCSPVPIITRNRDWSPVFNGIRASIGYHVTAEPQKDDEVLITYDSDDQFLGYISKKVFNYDEWTWDLTINHFLMKFEQYKVNEVDLHNELIAETADFTSEVAFTADAGTDYINSSSHGLSNGDRVQLRSTGTLPAGLSELVNYYVQVVDTNNFLVYKNKAEYATTTLIPNTVRKVNITDTGSGTHTYTTSINFDKYNDCGFYADIPATWDFNADQILSSFQTDISRNNRYQGNPVDGYYPQVPIGTGKTHFTIVEFYGANLPTGITEGQFYIAAWFYHANDNGFVLYADWGDYINNERINISGTPTTSIFFHVLLRFAVYDNENLVEDTYDENSAYLTPFVQLRHMIVQMFAKLGLTIDTTAIDDIVYMKNPAGATVWKWANIYFLEPMLYNLNQSIAVRPSDIDTSFSESQLTWLQLIQDVFGKLGIGIKYTGGYEYLLVSQKRASVTYFPTPTNEDLFSIDDDRKIKYYTELDEGAIGWVHSRFFGGMLHVGTQRALCHVFNDREKYFAYKSSTVEKNNSREAAGISNIDWYNNLLFFLKNFNTGSHTYPAEGLSWVLLPSLLNELYDVTVTGDTWSILVNQKNANSKIYTIQEIECRVNHLSQEVWTVNEITLNIEKRRITITQERPTT